MTSDLVGQATLRSSPRTSRRNSPGRGALLLRRPVAWRRRGAARLGRAVSAELALALQHALGLSVHCHGTACQFGDGRERSRAGGTRTPNRRFWRPVLFQLSYCPQGVGSGRSIVAGGTPPDRPGGQPAQPAPRAGAKHEHARPRPRPWPRRCPPSTRRPAAGERPARRPAVRLLDRGEDLARPQSGRRRHVGRQLSQAPGAACGTGRARPGTAGSARRAPARRGRAPADPRPPRPAAR